MTTLLEFNSPRDTAFAHYDDRFDRVLHLFHAHWHGIRSASACLPGHKLAIPHEGGMDGEFLRHVVGLIFRHRIRHICLQGVSGNAIELIGIIRAEFGRDLFIAGITHVTSSQFEYTFEIEMQRILVQALRRGVLDRIASVKPDFNAVVEEYWPETVYNCAPNITQFSGVIQPDLRSVFIPIENTWRKNLYTNVLAACRSPAVDTVFTVNRPTQLEDIADLTKIRVSGYMRAMNLYSFMGATGCVMNATLAECQPMTQLEAAAMGTPCITGPLQLAELQGHPVTKLTEVALLDTPVEMRRKLEALLHERSTDEKGFAEMMRDYAALRLRVCLDSYGRLLDL